MANKRYLPCGKKEVFAIGQENCINDLKEKLNVCFNCHKFIDCRKSQVIFDTIKRQQEALLYLSDKWAKEKA